MIVFSEKQLEIFKFAKENYDALICSGAVRSGKTSIMFLNFIEWAMNNFENKNFAICGKTVEGAIKNVVIPYLSLTYSQKNYILNFKKSEKILEIQRGNKKNYFEVFGGKDESSYQLIQGRTLAGIFFDEVVLMPESFVNQALARCSVDGSKFWFSCNPNSPTHWFFEKWIQKSKFRNAKVLNFQIDDNPSLSKKIIERYKNQYDGVFYQRYILGEWVLAEGLVYNCFDKEKHIFKELPEKKGIFYLSIDYGIVNPFVCQLWQVINKKAYCIKEYYYDYLEHREYKRTDEEHYKAIEEMAKDYNIQYIVIDPSATSFKETIARYGKYNYLNANNEVISGISNCITLLKNGYIKFHEDCSGIFKEFGLYSWNKKSKMDSVIKENDHSLDAFRYFVKTVLKREFNFNWERND